MTLVDTYRYFDPRSWRKQRPASVAGPKHAADAHQWYLATGNHSVAERSRPSSWRVHQSQFSIRTALERVSAAAVSMFVAGGELPLLSERNMQHRSAAGATATIMPISPVPLVHWISQWQRHGGTQHHDSVQHLAICMATSHSLILHLSNAPTIPADRWRHTEIRERCRHASLACAHYTVCGITRMCARREAVGVRGCLPFTCPVTCTPRGALVTRHKRLQATTPQRVRTASFCQRWGFSGPT